ncbi:MAG: arsenite methyltransferase [Anaerolineae bacterium]|nr:arsenite methyltransferase [Anaerolineae bacterium]MBL6966035.1 arsenite methyltransferase [Anaerolineales bacterium]
MTTQTLQKAAPDIRSAVRERYGNLAEQHQPGSQADCGCSSTQSSCCSPSDDLLQLETVARIYDDPAAFDLPADVTELSLGCGDPVTLAALEAGQTVLDLGSGGGIDCFLAAKKVGPAGKVIGVDMTPAMLERARANKAKLGADNVEFRLGEIENLPVADATVDVIISNCVINLSPDKPQVLRETFRVLRPGGKLAVSDIVTDGPLPQEIKTSLSAWAGCIAGALDVQDFKAVIEAAGFVDVEMKAEYWGKEMADEAIQQLGLSDTLIENKYVFDKTIFSAKITARKPE